MLCQDPSPNAVGSGIGEGPPTAVLCLEGDPQASIDLPE